MKYLDRFDYSIIDQKSLAYNLINSIVETNFLILDFNYTKSANIILNQFGFSESEINQRIIKVHGSLEDRKIIFGVEDSANIKIEHVFLKRLIILILNQLI